MPSEVFGEHGSQHFLSKKGAFLGPRDLRHLGPFRSK